MKKYIGQILTSILLGISILLALSFWLNIQFGFNLFYAEHWDELAKLQATHTPINKGFYVSICIAIILFIVGLYMIFRPRFRNIFKHQTNTNEYQSKSLTASISKTHIDPTLQPQIQKSVALTQPPKLNLPKNTAKLATQRYTEILTQQTQNSQLPELFVNAGYVVKPNLTIAGFTTNIFAIGTDELVWFGAVDCDITKFKNAVNRLKSIFEETLEDIPITISAFILDTKHLYASDNETLVFHSMDELKEFVNNNPNPEIPDSDRENFAAYSDYIDTIIQYAKNV